MKKFAAIALALILAMSSMFATVAVATNGGETVSGDNKLAFAGFEIINSGVVIDVENMRIYGLKPLLSMAELDAYLKPGTGFTVKAVDGAGEEVSYLGTGTKLVLNDGKKDYPFEVVIFGDLTGDSAIDVIDAAQAQRIHTGLVEATELTNLAGDTDKDGEITANDYSTQVNAALGEATIDQNATGSDKEGTVEVEEQVYTSAKLGDYKLADEDVTLTFNDLVVDPEHYTIGKCVYDKDADGNFFGTVEIKGAGLFSGSVVLKVEVISLLEKVVATVNEVIADANLSNVVTAKYEVVNGVADIKVEVNASNIIHDNFNVDMSGLNGLLTKIDEFKARHLQEATLTVGDLAIATNGDFDRSAIKALVFDIAKGLFCDIANADDNVIKSYSGVLVTNNKIADLAEEFNIDVVMTADAQRDIDRVKAFAKKIARYVAFDVVDGNAVIDIIMPAAFSTKVVDVLSNGTGDIERARKAFNDLYVGDALGYLARVSPEDISAGSVKEIEQALTVATKLVALANKALDEVDTATVTDVNGKVYKLLNGNSFAPDNANTNKVNAFVTAVGKMLTDEVLDTEVANFCKDGIYTVAADVAIDYRNISETIIVNFDLFTSVETPSVIEETAEYFSNIINTLGIANVAAVSYDEDAFRALVTMNATELLAGNLQFNDKALDGLYTDIKGYFDDNYGTATIIVDGYEIVTAGAINKSALKAYLFDFVNGFFADVADINGENIIRSSAVKVTEADGTEHKFDLDFQLTGDAADVAKIASISGKVANYVSLDTTSGNAVVNVEMPAGMTNKIIDTIGSGSVEAAKAALSDLDVGDLLGYVARVSAEDISASNADEINTIIEMVAGMDAVVNKLLGKVASATAYDVNGNAMALLSGDAFVVEDASIAGVTKAFAKALSDEIINTTVANFVNADGIYTITCDVALTVGGIKETVILNVDIFGDLADEDEPVVPDVPEETKDAIEETVDYVGEIIADLGISNVASVAYSDGKAVATLDASEVLNNGLSFKDEALDGLYTEIRGYFDETFGDSTITVAGYTIVKDGAINKSAVKDLVFDFATGFFTDVANMDAETLRNYATVVTEADGTVHSFDLELALAGDPEDLATVKSIAGKVADHVTFAEVNGNAVVSATMPVGMTNKIVEVLGSGSEAEAQAKLNALTVEDLLGTYVYNVSAEDISASNADEINKIVEMVAGMDAVINKLLGKVSDASITDVNGNKIALLNGSDFVVADASIKSLVSAFGGVLTEAVLGANLSDFVNNDGTYTFACDVALTVGGIKETVIFNLDIFGDIEEEEKDAAEETVDYVGDIIADLGISNVASVAYSDGKAVATFNADEILAGNLKFDDGALDGLYTDVKDYFKSNYGDSTIKVGEFELVTDGAINKSEVKDFVFDFAKGFFTDLANMDAETLRSYEAVVVDANGEAESFVFDFALAGEPEALETIQSVAGKVADHVSFTEVNGNAVVSLSAPSGMKDKMVAALQATTVEEAKEKLNALTVEDLLGTYVYNVSPEDISASNAEEIETIVNMVAGMDAVVNKLLGKVSKATVEIDGAEVSVLNGNDFVVETATISGLVSAFGKVLTEDILGAELSNFVNDDGSYTIELDAGLSIGGIKETVVFNFNVF